MAVDLQTSSDSSLPYDSLLPPSTDFTHSNNFDGSDSNPKMLISSQFGSHTYSTTTTTTTTTTPLPPHSTQPQDKDEDLFDELTQHIHMSHSMLQQDHKLDSSDIDSDDLEPLKPSDSTSCWSQSSVWSPLCSNQGSSEGSLSPKEPSESGNIHDSDCYYMLKMIDKMNFNGSDDSSKSGSTNLETSQSHVGVCSTNEYILNEQIRANQLSRHRQEQILSLQQKLAAYRENHSHISPQFQKKGKGADVGVLNKQAGLEKQVSEGDTTGSRGTSCGTGVFLPRGGVRATFESNTITKRPVKGCNTVLIPERVVQALQQHFDQIAATSGPKSPAIPPLHDALVRSNRDGMLLLRKNSDGMYSVQNRRAQKNQTHVQNEMILPGEWTY